MLQLKDLNESFASQNCGPRSGYVEFKNFGGKTQVTSQYAENPLRFLNPRNKSKAAWVYTSSYGGGFVGGDRIGIKLKLHDQAQAVFMSQSSTKIYRSLVASEQKTEAFLGEHSLLLTIPDPIVCFKGSSFRQEHTYHLASNASLLHVDILTAGRIESGERWNFDLYQNKIQIFRESRRIFLESILLDSSQADLAKLSGRFNVIGLMLLIGPTFQNEAREIVKSISNEKPSFRQSSIMSASEIGPDIFIFRFAATSSEQITQLIYHFVDFFNLKIGDHPWKRKY